MCRQYLNFINCVRSGKTQAAAKWYQILPKRIEICLWFTYLPTISSVVRFYLPWISKLNCELYFQFCTCVIVLWLPDFNRVTISFQHLSYGAHKRTNNSLERSFGWRGTLSTMWWYWKMVGKCRLRRAFSFSLALVQKQRSLLQIFLLPIRWKINL